MKYFSHLNTATELILQYRGQEPLTNFLKKFFSQHKKYGSKDRRRISHLCYVFYRVGKMALNKVAHSAIDAETIQQTILVGLFLCHQESDELLRAMKPVWDEKLSLPIDEKAAFLNQDPVYASMQLTDLFPWREELSKEIEESQFAASH